MLQCWLRLRTPYPQGPCCALWGNGGEVYARPNGDRWLRVPCLSQLCSGPPASRGFQPLHLLLLVHLGEGSSQMSQTRLWGLHTPASPHIPPTQRERLSPHCSSLQAQKTPLLSQSTLCPSPPRCGVTGPCSWQGKEQGFPQGSNAGSVPGGSPTLRLRQDTPVSWCPLTPASAHRCLLLQSGKLLFLGGQQLL